MASGLGGRSRVGGSSTNTRGSRKAWTFRALLLTVVCAAALGLYCAMQYIQYRLHRTSRTAAAAHVTHSAKPQATKESKHVQIEAARAVAAAASGHTTAREQAFQSGLVVHGKRHANLRVRRASPQFYNRHARIAHPPTGAGVQARSSGSSSSTVETHTARADSTGLLDRVKHASGGQVDVAHSTASAALAAAGELHRHDQGTTSSAATGGGVADGGAVAQLAGKHAAMIKQLLEEQVPLVSDNSFVDPSLYMSLDHPRLSDMDHVRKRLKAYVASDAFQQRVQLRRERNTRGIVINAGGPVYTTNLIIVLKVLREELLCTLPVEVFWQGPSEMDDTTLSSLEASFGPLKGADIQALPHPVAGLHKTDVPLTKFTGKVYALLQTSFTQVLMLDADSLPLMPPEVHFSHPQFLATGCLFWPAIMSDRIRPDAYAATGLLHHNTTAVLRRGRGNSSRDTESGQLLMDLGKHMDVAEYVFWLNGFAAEFGYHPWGMNGDKDTFALAFAVAGKAHLFSQVDVAPGGMFHKTKHVKPGRKVKRHMLGVLQHDSWGRPAFAHRTVGEFKLHHTPAEIEVVTAPVPSMWRDRYLDQGSWSTTPDALEVVPSRSRVTRAVSDLVQASLQLRAQGCPHSTLTEYWAARHVRSSSSSSSGGSKPLKEAGEPLSDLRCLALVPQLMGNWSQEVDDASLLVKLSVQLVDGWEWQRAGVAVDRLTPLAAWWPDLTTSGAADRSLAERCMRASYCALHWLEAHARDFPIATYHRP